MAIVSKNLQAMYLLYYRSFHVVEVTEDYEIPATDFTVICNSPNNIVLTLPEGTLGQAVFNLKNIGTGIVSVRGKDITLDTIDDESTQELYEGDCMNVRKTDAHKWSII